MGKMNAYLRDLLVLHDCVILPDFGGFVGNYQASQKLEQDYFIPPRKNIAFNPQLKDNDGLLANTVAAIEKIDYNTAATRVNQFVEQIKKELKAKGEYNIPQVGKLQNSKEERLGFIPDTTSNLLASSIGAYAFQVSTIQRMGKREKEAKGKIVAMPILRKALIAGVSGFALFSLLLRPAHFENLSLASIAPLYHEIEISGKPETKIKIEKPILTKTHLAIDSAPPVKAKVENMEKSQKTPKNYHIIVGCFSMKENAESQKKQLAIKGINTDIFVYNKSLTAVSAGSFNTFEEAKVLMDKLRCSGDAPSAWVWKKMILN